jgi:2-polyprenyl-3-methyl-5-hydroxy-6-metoxy-1,4-benzoquinol methylase
MRQYSDTFITALKAYLSPQDDLEIETYTRVDWVTDGLRAMGVYLEVEGLSFVDAGCGHGPFALAAHNLGMRVSGFDFVKQAVDVANLRFKDIGVPVVMTVHDIRDAVPPEHREAHDLVISSQVLEHLPRSDQFTAIRNLCDMVRPGGFLFIDTENSLCPHDRHDTGLPLVRLLAPAYQSALVEMLGKGINKNEISFGKWIQLHDYLSYDELVGAMKMMGFEAVNSDIPYGTPRNRFFSITGSHWLYDNIAQYFESERFMPVSALFQKTPGTIVHD